MRFGRLRRHVEERGVSLAGQEDRLPQRAIGAGGAAFDRQRSADAVEPMGAEAYLYLRAGQNSFIARVSGHVRPGVNQDLDLVIDINKAHFFDSLTEKTIL